MSGFIRFVKAGTYRVYASSGRKIKDFSSYEDATVLLDEVNANEKGNLQSLVLLAKEANLKNNEKLKEKSKIAIAEITGDLNNKADISYSSIMRDLKDQPEQRVAFMKAFKEAFDQAFLQGLENPDQIALFSAMKNVSVEEKKTVKEASYHENRCWFVPKLGWVNLELNQSHSDFAKKYYKKDEILEGDYREIMCENSLIEDGGIKQWGNAFTVKSSLGNDINNIKDKIIKDYSNNIEILKLEKFTINFFDDGTWIESNFNDIIEAKSFWGLIQNLRKAQYNDTIFDENENKDRYLDTEVFLNKSLNANLSMTQRSQDRMFKAAKSVVDMGSPEEAGKGIAAIIQFIMKRMDYVKRPHHIMNLKRKIWYLNENDIASKNAPQTAALGQAITFIKTILQGHNPDYIRKVLAEVIRHL
jgi:hypothetical protein